MSRRIAPAKAVKAAVYTIAEVAELFGVGRNSAYEAARRGDFPVLKIGGRLVAPKRAIDRMLGLDASADQEGTRRCEGTLETVRREQKDRPRNRSPRQRRGAAGQELSDFC